MSAGPGTRCAAKRESQPPRLARWRGLGWERGGPVLGVEARGDSLGVWRVCCVCGAGPLVEGLCGRREFFSLAVLGAAGEGFREGAHVDSAGVIR